MKRYTIGILIFIFGLQGSIKPMDDTSNGFSVTTALQITSSLLSIGLTIGPYLYRYVTTGSWSSDAYAEHQKVFFKQQEEVNAVKLSSSAMNVCWQNVATLKEQLESMPSGDQKNAMTQSLYDANVDCALLVAMHARLLSNINPHYEQSNCLHDCHGH